MTELTLQIPTNMSLRQQVIDNLRRSILTGNLQPGQKLIERELCEAMQISRTVLREALQHLYAEGLIVDTPRRGRMVCEISTDDASDIFEARAALEKLVGEGFARNATPEQIASLRACCRQIAPAEADGDHCENIDQIENRFFALMLDGYGNKVAADLFTLLGNRFTLVRRLPVFRAKWSQNIPAELQQIVCAIQARDIALIGHLCHQRIGKLHDAQLVTQAHNDMGRAEV
ncbi:GntR family transcriptional regulator [Thalassospira mesophila]|uniref:HTH gntR-type domain-containing protein n=1 Tax=Thalassospira mesophila TaxID=1293891 RepID=A0A1Y2KUN5_9PROT|nr:GntR family transcriptional regulator [Thalassospira mesophila]OSQ35230.1 hypothetical protein TMES_21655 [Thalassospira mesophila]